MQSCRLLTQLYEYIKINPNAEIIEMWNRALSTDNNT